MKKLVLQFSAAMLCQLAITSAFSDELSGTLQKVKQSGTLVLGVREASSPFSFIDDNQRYVGYQVDLCMLIADAVRKRIDAPDLKVTTLPVVSSTRIPLIANGTIDLECGTTTNNVEREAQVSFSPTTYVAATLLLSQTSSHISSLSDLKGKTVAGTAGSTTVRELLDYNANLGLGMNVTTVDDESTGLAMVSAGRIAAFGSDDIILYMQKANAKDPSSLSVTKEPLSVEPYGIMLRKNDPQFKKLVDDTITRELKSGQIDSIYRKWFTQPIPPKGINLNIPMSAANKKAFQTPTDSGDPTKY